MKKEAEPVKGIDQLISRIKVEAIEEADRKAAEILSGAGQEAARIVEEARLSAREITVSAEKEILRNQEAATKAIRRAGRDAVIETRQSILQLFSRVLQSEVQTVLCGDSLASFISAFITSLPERAGDGAISVRLSRSETDGLMESLRARLMEVAGEGLELRNDPDLTAGFRVGFRDGNFFYEISPESVTEILARHLKPELQALMNGKVES